MWYFFLDVVNVYMSRINSKRGGTWVISTFYGITIKKKPNKISNLGQIAFCRREVKNDSFDSWYVDCIFFWLFLIQFLFLNTTINQSKVICPFCYSFLQIEKRWCIQITSPWIGFVVWLCFNTQYYCCMLGLKRVPQRRRRRRHQKK